MALIASLLYSDKNASWWLTLIVILAHLTFVGLVFRTWLGPYILGCISDRVSIRSISLRSIRGVFIRTGFSTFRIDRIGISYHRPSAENARRFSVQIENLKVEIHATQVGTPRRHPVKRKRSWMPMHMDFSLLSSKVWALFSAFYSALEPFVRPVVRVSFIAVFRIVIRSLPALTQVLDFEMDQASVTFEEMSGANIVVKDAALSLKVIFTHLEKVIGPEDMEKSMDQQQRLFLNMAQWKVRFTSSFGRVWDRAWGGTEGSATVALSIGSIAGFSGSGTQTPISRYENIEGLSDKPDLPAGRFRPSSETKKTGRMFMDVAGTNRCTATLRFNPKLGLIERHSVSLGATISTIHVHSDALLLLTKSQQPKPDYSIFKEVARKHRSTVGSSASPTSPLMGVLSASVGIATWRRRVGASVQRKSQRLMLISLLERIDVTVTAISFEHTHSEGSGHPVVHTFRIRRAAVRLMQSSPVDNELHRLYLGCPNRDQDQFDADVYSLLGSTDRITCDRLEGVNAIQRRRLLSVRKLDIRSLFTAWPNFLQPPRAFYGGDPNSALLICELTVSNVEITEHLDELHNTIANITQTKPNRTGTSFPRILPHMPRVHLALLVDDIRVQLFSGSDPTVTPFRLSIASDGFATNVNSQFQTTYGTKRPKSMFDKNEGLPVEMELDIHSTLQATFIMVHGDTSLSENHSCNPSHIGDHSLLSLSKVELAGSGGAFGATPHWDQNSASLDTSTAWLDMSCVSDAIAIELWHPAVISALRIIARTFHSTAQTESRGNTRLRFIDACPTGVSLLLSVGQLSGLVTSPDINPADDLDLSRGVACDTGVSLQYCNLQTPGQVFHSTQLVKQAHARQRLYLSEDLLIRATSIINSQGNLDDKFVFLRGIAWNTRCRSAVATKYAADKPSDSSDDDGAVGITHFLAVQRCQVDVVLRRDHLQAIHNADYTEDTTVTVSIPQVQGSFSMLHAYSVVLAMQCLESLPGFTPRPPTTRRHAMRRPITITCRVDVMQIFVNLPLRQKLCVRFNGFTLQIPRDSDSLTGGWETLFLWIPNPYSDGEWVEFGRFQSWKLNFGKSGVAPITVDGEGARLRIPHGFVIADLILDLSVTLKGFRHITAIVRSGLFTNIGAPSAESSKTVPSINLKVKSITIEAADDPLESKTGLAWKAGLDAARTREEREDAFEAKVATIIAAESPSVHVTPASTRFRFSPQHSVSVDEARHRLNQVHSASWISRHAELLGDQMKREENILRRTGKDHVAQFGFDNVPLVRVSPPTKGPPLIRLTVTNLSLQVRRPSFSPNDLTDFLYDVGNGIPSDTSFSLLIPLHISFTSGSSSITLRDYPVPLLCITQSANTNAWQFDSDMVIAEEMGSSNSVVWKDCCVAERDIGIRGSKPFSISIPKTTMPVKTYALPTIHVSTTETTDFCWGISYNPALQDVMRLFDTFTPSPPDPSPPLGFWDKIKLILHCRIKMTFATAVQLNLKGSRDPYKITGDGAGFTFRWDGDTVLTIGHPNEDNELLQVISDKMFIGIPSLHRFVSQTRDNPTVPAGGGTPTPDAKQGSLFHKICAKFTSGIRWGVGIVLERSCSPPCERCSSTSTCRHFAFRPHYEVLLEPKALVPLEKTSQDSYNGFRSDFIHLSTSLTSSVRHSEDRRTGGSSKFHLTPKTFAHFWSWWDLFDSTLSLPIRQGPKFPSMRPASKKFGRHLATLKYRLSVSKLYISHVYIDDSRETWSGGKTVLVGVKAMVDHFQADMHQREQEAVVAGRFPGMMKRIRHKAFYAAEVNLTGLDLRAIHATFAEPLKQLIPFDVTSPGFGSLDDSTEVDASSPWFDSDDFVETDWFPPEPVPVLHLIPISSCPRFTYFKRVDGRNPNPQPTSESSRFGFEDTHVCFMGKETTVHGVQIQLATDRIKELRRSLDNVSDKPQIDGQNDDHPLVMISLLEQYISRLRVSDVQDSHNHPPTDVTQAASYFMPSDVFCSDDWAEFDNVYQFHCPAFFINNSTRNILMHYYYCSRSRRGFEYHMATRAVKFIRDQADAVMTRLATDNTKTTSKATNSAQAAAQVLRKILTGDDSGKTRMLDTNPSIDDIAVVDPLKGWSEGVTLEKSHFCLLLKPQVVLRSELSHNSVCVLAALQATLQGYAVLDTTNVDDPVSGKIMTRSYAMLNGLQTFSPSSVSPRTNQCVPLEVLVDLRCASTQFDRLVPQTDATFQYDKFNRLRLRNNITTVADTSLTSHLQFQTDLIDITVPRFTVSANSRHFEAISNILTNLLLFSDSAHKTHLSKVETLLFSYDFTDLVSASNVVARLQSRLRRAVEMERSLCGDATVLSDDAKVEVLKIKAHIFLLSEELNLIFDAIKLAQDKADGLQNDQKSALQILASSSEISWGMLNDEREMITKLSVKGINFSWISRRDSSTVNKLAIEGLQAFDGSPSAEWPEILSKHIEPSSHPLVKRGIFVQADWSVLAPVGGIKIYEHFLLDFHPMRLQLDERVGRQMMEYLWPARRARKQGVLMESNKAKDLANSEESGETLAVTKRSSLDLPPTLRGSSWSGNDEPAGPSVRPSSSRSFTDLREARPEGRHRLTVHRSFSSYALVSQAEGESDGATRTEKHPEADKPSALDMKKNSSVQGDAAEMRTRSSQNTFILIRVSSLHLLLSLRKEDSFFCRDARIRTRELEYRNQTWSFEELAEQFIPSDPSWKGWVRMAFHQPLVPILPVARELISKTKLINAKGNTRDRKNSRPPTPAKAKAGGPSKGSSEQPLEMHNTTSSAFLLEDNGESENGNRTNPAHRSRSFRLFHRDRKRVDD